MEPSILKQLIKDANQQKSRFGLISPHTSNVLLLAARDYLSSLQEPPNKKLKIDACTFPYHTCVQEDDGMCRYEAYCKYRHDLT